MGKQALGEFEGDAVLSTTIAVTNAGDGLSKAMAVDPQLIHDGDEVFVVLRCECARIAFERVKDTDGYRRVHTLRAGVATIIDAAVVKDAIDRQAERIREAEDDAKGQGRLGFTAEQQKRSDHVMGEHASGLVDGCPLCAEERDAEKAEGDGTKGLRGRGVTKVARDNVTPIKPPRKRSRPRKTPAAK